MLSFGKKTQVAIRIAGHTLVDHALNINKKEEVALLIADLKQARDKVVDAKADTDGRIQTIEEDIKTTTTERDQFERNATILLQRSETPQARPDDAANAELAFNLKTEDNEKLEGLQHSLTVLQTESIHYGQALTEINNKIQEWTRHKDQIETNSHGAHAEAQVVAALRAGEEIDGETLNGIDEQSRQEEHIQSARLSAALARGKSANTQVQNAVHATDFEAFKARVLGHQQ